MAILTSWLSLPLFYFYFFLQWRRDPFSDRIRNNARELEPQCALVFPTRNEWSRKPSAVRMSDRKKMFIGEPSFYLWGPEFTKIHKTNACFHEFFNQFCFFFIFHKNLWWPVHKKRQSSLLYFWFISSKFIFIK